MVLEPVWILDVKVSAVSALVYSSVIVAFACYLTWFKLIHTYPVSQLSVFTFLTPVFGVLAGTMLLNEQLTSGLVFGLLEYNEDSAICGRKVRSETGRKMVSTQRIMKAAKSLPWMCTRMVQFCTAARSPSPKNHSIDELPEATENALKDL